MARRLSGAQSGANVSNKAAKVLPTQTGASCQLRAPLKSPVTWTKLSGHSNLTVVGAYISLAAGIPLGESQSIVVRAVSGNTAVEFEITLTGSFGPIPLLALTFSDGSALQFSDGIFLEFTA